VSITQIKVLLRQGTIDVKYLQENCSPIALTTTQEKKLKLVWEWKEARLISVNVQALLNAITTMERPLLVLQ